MIECWESFIIQMYIFIMYLLMIHLLKCMFSGNLIQKMGSTNGGFLIPYHYPLKRGYHQLPVFTAMLCKVNFKPGTRTGKHDDVTSRNKA